MANLTKEAGGFTQRKLMASFTPSQVTRDKKTGEVTGAFVTVQIDQSDRTMEDAKAGKCDTNPYLNSSEVQGEDGKTFVSHNIWYGARQMRMATQCGSYANIGTKENPVYGLTFTADLASVTDPETKKTKAIARMPKDVAGLKAAEEAAKAALAQATGNDRAEKQKALEEATKAVAEATAYNQKHPFTPGPKPTAEMFKRQADITAAAKEARDAAKQAKAAAKTPAKAPSQAAAEMPFADAAQAQAETNEPMPFN